MVSYLVCVKTDVEPHDTIQDIVNYPILLIEKSLINQLLQVCSTPNIGNNQQVLFLPNMAKIHKPIFACFSIKELW